MRTARTWLGQLWPHLLAAVLCTLFVAWALPLLLAMRGLGPATSGGFTQRLVAVPAQAIDRGLDSSRWPASIEVHRDVFSDWCVAQPAGEGPDGPAAEGRAWPDGALHESRAGRHVPPIGCVVAPPEADRDRYARIDTGLAGWPFRAFASEAWFRASPRGWFEPVPELRWSWSLGLVQGQPALVALRPLPFGLALDILFWAAASWTLVAAPRAIRRRRRERAGNCGSCGHRLHDASIAQQPRCPECGAATPRDPLGFASNPEMLHQNAYVWFVFVSSLDIMLTWKILERGGVEVNPVAELVIGHWGMHGAIAFKFALMMFVIVTCEISGRIRPRTGRALSIAAVAVSAIPVAWSLFLLAVHEFFP